MRLLCLVTYLPSVLSICYDQSPFWFLARPQVTNLLDQEGRIMSNKVRVKWGNMHNFKCVDYFQVEYRQVNTFFIKLSFRKSTISQTVQLNR